MVNMKILDLPLKAKWYEMIESGNKKEEYREIKKYWIGRLAKCGGRNSYEKTGFYCKKAICFSCITRGNGFHPKEYTHVCFRFGYTKRTMLFELESITIGVGNTNWGAPDNECVFILKLGIGSGSSRIAAYGLGFDFYATEIDEEYFEAQEERFHRECFGEIKTERGTLVQTNLFDK